MEQLYSIREVASKLGVHFNTVLNMISRGDIKASKIGRQWRIKESEIKCILDGEPNERDMERN